MITPSKGDIVSIPLNLQGQHVAEAWDPAKDEAAGEQCKAYGAPGLMRGPIRMRISWLDDNTLEGRNRLRHADASAPLRERRGPAGTAQLAGRHDRANGSCAAAAARGPRFGTLKTVTTNLRPDTCGRMASPTASGRCSRNTGTCTRVPNGDRLLVDTNVVDDPGLPPAAVPDGDPLQARTRRQQVGSDTVRCAILT